MKYIIQIETIAGPITLGPFNTLRAARKYRANTRGLICPIWPPVADPVKLIEAPHHNIILNILENK